MLSRVTSVLSVHQTALVITQLNWNLSSVAIIFGIFRTQSNSLTIHIIPMPIDNCLPRVICHRPLSFWRHFFLWILLNDLKENAKKTKQNYYNKPNSKFNFCNSYAHVGVFSLRTNNLFCILECRTFCFCNKRIN